MKVRAALITIVCLLAFIVQPSALYAQEAYDTFKDGGGENTVLSGKKDESNKDGKDKKRKDDGKKTSSVKRYNYLRIGENPQNPFRALQDDEMLVKPLHDWYILTKGGIKADVTSTGYIHRGLVLIVKKEAFRTNNIREFVVADCGNESGLIVRGDKTKTLQPIDTKDLFVFSWNGMTDHLGQIGKEGFPAPSEGKGGDIAALRKAFDEFVQSVKERDEENAQERDRLRDAIYGLDRRQQGADKEKEGGASWIPWAVGGVVVATLATIAIIALNKANKAERRSGGGTTGGPSDDPVNKKGYLQLSRFSQEQYVQSSQSKLLQPPRAVSIGIGFSF